VPDLANSSYVNYEYYALCGILTFFTLNGSVFSLQVST
jgi:hypothetical protein